MRNLKRVLSLTLASVMLLGMMVIGTSAAQGYNDVDETHNVEAIEVLQAIGVMTGDADANGNLTGTLRPDENVTRGEMARVMAALMDLDSDYYSGSGIHPFTDMVGHWAEPFAAACKANGIIAGRTDTTYDPNAYVTAIEAASMMMRALGYFQYSSDYAAGFEVSTVAQGTRIGIFDGVGSTASTPMTRNQVAQIALNTLKSGMVEPDDSTISITTPDGTTVQAGKVNYYYRTSDTNNAWVSAISSEVATGVNGANGNIVELGEQLYNGDLRLDGGAQDAFGRPANQWSFKSEDVGVYGKNMIASYTSTVKDGALYSLLGSRVYNNYDLTVYANGQDVRPKASFGGDNYVASRSTSNNTVPGTGNGVLTEIYLDDDTEEVTIVMIDTYVAEVITDYDEDRDAVTIEIKDTVTPGGVKANGYNANSIIEIELYGGDFPEIADLREGDYILFNYSVGTPNPLYGPPAGNDAIECIAPARVVTGEVTSVTDDDDDPSGSLLKEAVIGGTPYGYNANYTGRGKGTDRYELGTDASVVLDAYGYIIYDAEAIAANNNFLYVDGIVRSTGFSNRASANVYFADGTNDIITVSEITVRYMPGVGDQSGTATSTASMTEPVDSMTPGTSGVEQKADSHDNKYAEITLKDLGGSVTLGASGTYGAPKVAYDKDDAESIQFDGWYSYSKKSDGTYKLTQLWRDDHTTDDGTKGSQVAYVEVDGTDDSQYIKGGLTKYFTYVTDETEFTANTLNANNATTFILVNDGKIHVYEGVRNLPDIELNKSGSGNDAIVTAAKKDGADVASVVLIIDDDARIKGAKTEDLLYLIKVNKSYTLAGKDDGELIIVYDVILNGEKTTIESKQDTSDSNITVPAAYRSWTIVDGYYEFDDDDMSDNWPLNDEYVAGGGSFTAANSPLNILYEDGYLKIGGDTYQVDNDTMIRVLLTGGSSNNEILNAGDNNVMRKTYTASGLAALDGSLGNPTYTTGFTYTFYGILTDDYPTESDTLKVLYVVISQAKT